MKKQIKVTLDITEAIKYQHVRRITIDGKRYSGIYGDATIADAEVILTNMLKQGYSWRDGYNRYDELKHDFHAVGVDYQLDFSDVT